MSPRVDVLLGSLEDHAVRLEAQASETTAVATGLQAGIESLRSATSGRASDAAQTAGDRAVALLHERAGQLTRHAATARAAADAYEACDLAGARALGA